MARPVGWAAAHLPRPVAGLVTCLADYLPRVVRHWWSFTVAGVAGAVGLIGLFTPVKVPLVAWVSLCVGGAFASQFLAFKDVWEDHPDTLGVPAPPEVDLYADVRRIWAVPARCPIHLICAAIPSNLRLRYADKIERDYLRLARFADVDSLYHLRSLLSMVFPGTRVYEATSEEVNPQAFNEYLVLIGGPAWNGLASATMEQCRFPWRFQDGGPGKDDPLKNSGTGVQLLPETSSTGSTISDVGYFARFPSPSNPDVPLTLASGIRTFGVLGAARCFDASPQGRRNAQLVHAKLKLGDPQTSGFAAVFRVPVIDSLAGCPDLTSKGVLIDLLRYRATQRSFESI